MLLLSHILLLRKSYIRSAISDSEFSRNNRFVIPWFLKKYFFFITNCSVYITNGGTKIRNGKLKNITNKWYVERVPWQAFEQNQPIGMAALLDQFLDLDKWFGFASDPYWNQLGLWFGFKIKQPLASYLTSITVKATSPKREVPGDLRS